MVEQPSAEDPVPLLDAPPGISVSAGPRIQQACVNGNGQEPQHGAVFSQPENLTNGSGEGVISRAGPAVGVYVGGLPVDIQDEEVRSALHGLGDVLEVSVARDDEWKCKGYATVKFRDHTTAERGCSSLKTVRSMPVAAHILCNEPPEALPRSEAYPLPMIPPDHNPSATINTLLNLLRSQTDKKAAVAAAIRAVKNRICGRQQLAEDEDEDDKNRERQESVLLLDMGTYLDNFPNCKHLMVNIRLNAGGENKTPLAVLHEYATRCSLELAYSESSQSNMGPFSVEAKLNDIGGQILATGAGKGRNKKDAKQISAAATLEALLETVAEENFMQPRKTKQRMQGPRNRGRLGSGNWNVGGGQGRESWSRRGGRGRGGQPTGMRSNNRGVRGGLEAGHKRKYASAMLASPGEAHLKHPPRAQALNLLGLAKGGVVQGGAPLGPLLNQGIGMGDTGMDIATMVPSVGTASAGAGMPTGMANTMGGVSGNLSNGSMMGTIPMANTQMGGQMIGAVGVGNGGTVSSGAQLLMSNRTNLNGGGGALNPLGGGFVPFNMSSETLMPFGGGVELPNGQHTNTGMLGTGTANLGHVPMTRTQAWPMTPAGSAFFGSSRMGQQTQPSRFGH